jgi:hypothetical protein
VIAETVSGLTTNSTHRLVKNTMIIMNLKYLWLTD